MEDFESSIDFVPKMLPPTSGRARLTILEDNEPVIKMCIKRRWPHLRYVPRTHRIDLDWLFDRINDDPGIFIRHIGTKNQLGDILTKGQFTGAQFEHLVSGCMLGLKLPIDEKRINVCNFTPKRNQAQCRVLTPQRNQDQCKDIVADRKVYAYVAFSAVNNYEDILSASKPFLSALWLVP